MSYLAPLPRVHVTAEGDPLAADDARALSELRVQQHLSLPAQCELVFRDPAGPLRTGAALQPGSALRIEVGTHATPLFVGEVTAVEHTYGPSREHEIRVRAYDLLHRLRKRQPVRVHVEFTLEDLAEEMAAEAGLGVDVRAAEAGPVWQRLVQHRQSDLDLLAEVAAQSGLFLTLRDGTLHLLTLAGTGEALALTWGTSLLEARAEMNGEASCRLVAAAGWDALRVEAYQGEATEAQSGRAVAARVTPGQVNGSGERSMMGEAVQDQRHAEALAQAELDRRVAYEVTLQGVAAGDPRLQPGIPVEVTGLADAFNGRYVPTSVAHTLDHRAGFLTEFSTAPPPLPERPQGTLTTLGLVTQVDDPEGLGRVRATLPAYGDLETGWMQVLSLGAGENKGLTMLPDVKDHVLVLFAQRDPVQGVVLGGLYGMGGPADSGVEGTSVRRYTLATPGGQRVLLSDTDRRLRLENSDGSYVELSPERVRVHAATDLTLEAPGRTVAIRAKRINFEEA